MQTSRQLFEAGQLNQAIEALSAELREHPSDAQRRTFLFELLCFAGNWDRADKQLEIMAGSDPAGTQDRRLGALLYRAAMTAERTRHDMFRDKKTPAGAADPQPVGGVINGREYDSIEDADGRIGARLEVLAGGDYMWVPLEQISSVKMEPPKRLRDLLWAPASIQTTAAFAGGNLGEVLIPVLSPFSSAHPDDAVRLGRMTVWEEQDGEAIPFGQKMLLAGAEEIPLLELRSLEIRRAAD